MDKKEELLPYYKKAKEILNYNHKTGVVTKFIKSKNDYKKVGTINMGYRNIGITINGKQQLLKAHRVVWFIYYGDLPNFIDHVNGLKDDNRISNLRSCTHQENLRNRAVFKNNKSGLKGVSWYKKTNKWRAQIQINGNNLYLGYYNCPKEASEVYKAKAKELHGEFYHV